MKYCPICRWDLTPTRSTRFKCWVVMCMHWVCYATTKGKVREGWKKQYEKWLKEQG